jgi:hypothetical protein
MALGCNKGELGDSAGSRWLCICRTLSGGGRSDDATGGRGLAGGELAGVICLRNCGAITESKPSVTIFCSVSPSALILRSILSIA